MTRNSPRIKQQPTMMITMIRMMITSFLRRLSTRDLAGHETTNPTKKMMKCLELVKVSIILTGEDLTHWMTGALSSTRKLILITSTSTTNLMKMTFLKNT